MLSCDGIEESRKNLRLALEYIGKYELPTDPINYCVWYEYASGKNRDLNNEIDKHIQSGKGFTGDASQEIYDQFIAGPRESSILLVRSELENLCGEITKSITTTKRHFTASENSFEAMNGTLTPNSSKADVNAIVGQIKKEIKKLESASISAETRLQEATSEIDQLKTKMDHYKSEAFKDPLTQITNRRGFDKRLKENMDAAHKGDGSLCLIIADIDHFKKVNDTYGHLIGDNVLRIVANTIKDSIKGKDLVARTGGEEFAILLPDTPLEGAMKVAENIRLAFGGLDLKRRDTGESLGKISLSFGVTVFKEKEDPDDFIHRADTALYQSKETGRNKVTAL